MQDYRSTDSLHYVPVDGRTGIIGTTIKGLSAIISLSLIVGIVIWSYRLGVRDANDLPVIRAMDGLVRTQPDDPGGTQADHQGLEVNGVLANNEEPPVSTDITTAPGAPGLTEEDAAQGVLNGSEEPATGQQTGASVAALIEGLEATPAEPVAELAPVEDPLTRLAALRPQARPDTLNTSITSAEEVFTAVEPEVTEVAAVEPAIKPGDRLIQLGAFDSAEIAEEKWLAVLQANSDLLGGKQHVIQEATSGGRIFYRLRVFGFAGLDESRALCSALQPRDVPCIPVTAR